MENTESPESIGSDAPEGRLRNSGEAGATPAEDTISMTKKESARKAFLKALEEHPLCIHCNTNPHAPNDRRCNPCRRVYAKKLRKENGGAWYHQQTPEQYHKRLMRQRKYDAVKWGRLIPQPCAVCGGIAEAHHYKGYSVEFALVVAWMCRLHHRQLEKYLRLTNSPQVKY